MSENTTPEQPKKKLSFKQILESINKDYGRKTTFVTLPSVPIDIFFAMLNAYMGVLSFSLWHFFMCGYFIMLLFIRLGVITRAGGAFFSRDKETRLYKNHRKFHISLLFMDVILGIFMYIMLQNRVQKSYPLFIIFFVALYTLYKVVLALINLFKAHRSQSTIAIELRKIGQVDALVSLLILESALINRFGDIRNLVHYRISVISGIVVCAIILIMAIAGLARKRQ
ncbi:MAG: hypothetical protein IKE53_10345 [Clostridiales bacterium]|nr:hypothetical protein [Clostridiales bacterium]